MRSGYHWFVSAPMNPYQRSKPRPEGHPSLREARFSSSSAHRCHLPTMNVLQPCSPRISGAIAHSNGMWPLAFENPEDASEMQAIPFVVWLRPVNRHERVGEHSAVVWKFVYCRPFLTIRLMVGVSI